MLLLPVVAVALLIPQVPTDGDRESASAGWSPTLGVQTHLLWAEMDDAERIALLDRVAAAGLKWIRVDIGWCSVEEDGPGEIDTWYLDSAKRVLDAAHERGLQVLMTLWCSPEWANGGQSREVPPSGSASYARIAGVLARDLAERVDAWEVWNEPNSEAFWAGADPKRYVEMLCAAYPAIKSGDPQAQVVFGGVSYNDAEWIGQAYAAGAQGCFDVMATHPYMGKADAPPEERDITDKYSFMGVKAVRDVMVLHGDSNVPIWFTEFGWSVHENTGREENWERGVGPQQQADYLIRAIALVQRECPYVTQMFWYKDRTMGEADPHTDGYALLDEHLRPSPAYKALKSYLSMPWQYSGGAPLASGGGR